MRYMIPYERMVERMVAQGGVVAHHGRDETDRPYSLIVTPGPVMVGITRYTKDGQHATMASGWAVWRDEIPGLLTALAGVVA